MQNRVNVNYNEKQSVSDIFTLTNVVTKESVALIPSDSAGNFSWTGITKAPIVRNAMQTSNTSGEWSDLEYPYMAIPQEDWTGGRANLRFTTDKSRFYDSRRGQTAYNACIYNAPLDHYSEFYEEPKAITNCPASLVWKKIAGGNRYLIRKISNNRNRTIGKVYIHLRRRGTPKSGLHVQLLDRLKSSANIIAEHTFNLEEITDITAEFRKFTFEDTIISGDVYLKIYSEYSDTSNYWEVGCTNVLSTTQQSPTGTDGSWNLAQFDLLFRLDAPDVNDIRYKFFMYEQLMFMVQQKPNGQPRLFMNGLIAQMNSATATTVTKDSAGWDEDQYKGARIGLVYKHGIEGQNSVWKTIVENDTDTITVDSPWDVVPEGGTEFIIVDTPYWTEITNHQFTSAITDIHVVRGVVYFCQGDYTPIHKMRWHNGQFEWQSPTNTKASFIHSVRDRNGMMLYVGRNDDDRHLRSVERSRLLDWEEPREIGVFDATESYKKGDYTMYENILYQFIEDHDAGAWKSTDVADMSIEPGEGEYFPEDDPEGKIVAIIKTAVTPDRGTIYTESVDFEYGDFDARQYVVDVTSFSSDKNTGTAVITVQESEDNYAFNDIQSVTVRSSGRYYIVCHCQRRYRRLKIVASGTNCSINNISVKMSGVPHFEDRVTLLDNYGKITRLFEYGSEQEKSLWVFQEGMVSSINKTENTVDTYNLDRINLDELAVTADEWNGSAVGTSDVYLLWAWQNGLQRFYNTQLEGKGPDHDEGMPKDMQGRITSVLSYPGSFFVSIDGEDGYSSIMLYNGSGWHNIYRAPNKNERIFDIAFQPIYGNRPDRLWAQVGENVIWLSMPSKILYALKDPNAEYTHEGIVVSAWITGGMAEVDKLWQSLSIMADYLDGKTCWVEADYQLDDEETWHPIKNLYTHSPQQEENFAGEDESVNGKKLRYRLRLQTTDIHKTPKVNVVLVKALGRVDIKYSYGFHFRNIKYKADLTGEYEEIEPYELDELLSKWANELATLRLNSAYRLFDDKRVFLDGLTTNVVYEKGEGYLSQITLTEI